MKPGMTRSVVAYIIDIFITTCLRFIFGMIAYAIWFRFVIQKFKDAILNYGNSNNIEVDQININDMLEAISLNGFTFNLMVFIFIIIIVDGIYQFLMYKSKWSSTFGRKIMYIRLKKYDGKPLQNIDIVNRILFAFVYWLLIPIMIGLYMNHAYGLLILIGFVFLFWNEVGIFCDKKFSSVHDYLSMTRFVVDKEGWTKYPWGDRFFNNNHE